MRPSEIESIEALVRAEGLEIERLTARALDPGTITLVIIGSVAAIAAAQAAIETYRGGQIIDLRPEAPSPFYRSRQLHYGLVAVISDSGIIRVNVIEPREMFSKVVEVLIVALSNGAQADADLRSRVQDAIQGLPDVELEESDPRSTIS